MATAFDTVAPSPLKFIHPDDMPDLYALKGVGTCMEPVVTDGTLLVFDKREQPAPGDTVGLVFTQEYAKKFGAPGCIKRLRMALPPMEFRGAIGLIVAEQINPHRVYTFKCPDVLAVHKCVGFAEADEQGGARFRLNQEAPR